MKAELIAGSMAQTAQRGRSARAAGLGLAAALACGASPGELRAPAPIAAPVAEEGTPEPVPEPPATVAPERGDPVSEPEPPHAIRSSTRTILVYAEPAAGAEVRGQIAPGHAFFVYASVTGEGCPGEGWARVGPGAFACLRFVRPSEQAPENVPALGGEQIVPFVYARPRSGANDGSATGPARWRSRAARRRGDPPMDHLLPYGRYAFTQRRGRGVKGTLVDEHRRVVSDADMRLFRPSRFAGRDLVERPLPPGRALAWTRVREAELRGEPAPKAPASESLPYHAELEIEAAPIESGGSSFHAVVADDGTRRGFVEAGVLRRFSAPPPEPRIAEDELWIDVDVGAQILTVVRGSSPIFATLVSTGKPGDATPAGLYRILVKKGWDDMHSAAGEQEPWFVEAVPWAQYFHRDFALHSAYWHDLFGNRTSHGCVNLSPLDGARLYGLTLPTPPPGWLAVHASSREPGTSVRIRNRDRPVPDRRDVQPEHPLPPVPATH